MIYLFEDRKDRMHNLLSKNINQYRDIINVDEKIEAKNPNEFQDFISTLNEADIFMIHKSYTLEKNLSVSKIKTYLRNAGKKIIIFSGGTNGGAIIDEQELVLNSGILYENLPFFLEKYKEHGNKTELVLLLFGNNKRLYLHQLKKFKIESLYRLLKYVANNNTTGEKYINLLKKLIETDLDYLEEEIFYPKKEKLKIFLNKRIKKGNIPEPALVFDQIQKMIKAIKDEDLQNI